MHKMFKDIIKLHLKFPKYVMSKPASAFKQILGEPSTVRWESTCKHDNVYLIDEDSNTRDIACRINKYTKRTRTCGELNIEHVGENVTLCGWLQYKRMNKFAILRDSYGETQLVISDKDEESQNCLKMLPLESILEVKGAVLARPANMRNLKQNTGDVEVFIEKINILNEAIDKLPFNIREFQKAKEPLRMQYRYLDLRFSVMQRNLRVRSQMLMEMRQFLYNAGFVDVETPTLFRATPGGAQEFIVPTRFPGQFYALVQSPQQFKQMLMAGAIDRYYQIARCYRDEGARPDRQPEFTQLDIEMSFTSLDGILQLVEEMLGKCWPKFSQTLPKSFPRITYRDAMEQYGTDQPDTTFEYKLQNYTAILRTNDKLVSSKNFGAYYLLFPEEFAILGKSLKETFTALSKKYPNIKFFQHKVNSDLVDKAAKLLTKEVANSLVQHAGIKNNNVLFLSFGDKTEVLNFLGKVRVEYANHLEHSGINIRKKGMHLLWVVDFPLFDMGETVGSLKSNHHPFTSPNSEDLHLLETSPLEVRSLSFDLVLNGNEIGGGSVRIYDSKLQEKILKMLTIDPSTLQHILDMLSSGCPPHGGIALGIDRLLSKILSTASIRDVIAFPKGFEGRDPLSGAPSPISEADQKLYHIKTAAEKS